MMKHTHSAAYRLYKYQCTQCLAIEHIWNSRDGYVPHNVMCGCCRSESTKMETEAGRYYTSLPSYALRVFVDVSKDEAFVYAAQQLEHIRQNGPDEIKATLRDEIAGEAFINERVENIYGRGNRPHTIFRLEYIQRLHESSNHA